MREKGGRFFCRCHALAMEAHYFYFNFFLLAYRGSLLQCSLQSFVSFVLFYLCSIGQPFIAQDKIRVASHSSSQNKLF